MRNISKNMENKFFLTNAVEKIKRGESSFFLDPKEFLYVSSLLRKQKVPYQVFKPYPMAEKVLIYRDSLPDMELLEITSKEPLFHRFILGTFFAHQILPYFYSDIMIRDSAYVVALKPISKYMQDQILTIGKIPVCWHTKDLSVIENFEPKYETIFLHVPSLRFDAILAKLLKVSRKQVLEKIESHEVFLNYEECMKRETLLKVGDVFSIRGYGKYIFRDIVYQNKKGNMDLEIHQYR